MATISLKTMVCRVVSVTGWAAISVLYVGLRVRNGYAGSGHTADKTSLGDLLLMLACRQFHLSFTQFQRKAL